MKFNKKIIFLSILLLFTYSFLYFDNSSNVSRDNFVDNLVNLESSSESGGGYIMNTSALYEWIEINETGVVMSMISDSAGHFETINFDSWSFSFYETLYNKLYVKAFGAMSFTYEYFRYDYAIPNLNEDHQDLVALLMDPTQPSEFDGGGGTIYYQFLTDPNRLIIEYKDMYTMNDYGGSEYLGSYEVIFYESGKIKFQYQEICNLVFSPAKIGLDHGDLTNYNVYDEITTNTLPVSDFAIEFTFNEMIPVEYGLTPEVNQEFSWMVEYANDDKMEMIFGPNWEISFGLPENPRRGEKTKINILQNDLIGEDLFLSYEIWDWTYRLDNFSSNTPLSDSLYYQKDPTLNGPEYMLPNTFPLIAPIPLYLYLRDSNISSFYSHYSLTDSSIDVRIGFYDTRDINGHYIRTYGGALYNSEGNLKDLKFSMYNHTAEDYEVIFQLTELTSDHMLSFTMNLEENSENAWLVSYVNDEKMGYFLGSEWETLFGFSSKPYRSAKIKSKIIAITNDSTSFNIEFLLEEWTERSKEFSGNFPYSDNLQFRIDPYDYEYPTVFKNFLPFYLPSPTEYYLAYSNIDHDFDQSGDPLGNWYEPVLTYYEHRYINGYNLNLRGKASYDSNGILSTMKFTFDNDSIQETVFELVHLTPELLLNGSFTLEENDEKVWLVSEVNQGLMEEFFGSNWEDSFGLPDGMDDLEKIKMRVNSISEDSSNITLNYEFWDWTSLFEEFSGEPTQVDSLCYRKDPFSYEETHLLPNMFPLVLPCPTELYFMYSFLDSSVYQIQEDAYFTPDCTRIYYSITNNENQKTLSIQIVYNNAGYLSEMRFKIYDWYSQNLNGETAFHLIEIYEGEKPDYVEVNLHDVYEYGIYFFEGIYPGALPDNVSDYERVKMSIDYIGAEDPIRNRTFIYINATFLDENENWIKLTEDEIYYLVSFIPFYDLNFVFEDLKDIFYNQILGIPRIVPSDINWTRFVEDIYEYDELINDPNAHYYHPIQAETLENGFEIKQDLYGDELSQLFLYTEGGVLNISSLGFNGEEFFTCRLNDFNYGEEIIINATLDVKPDILNLQSNRKWITAYIELPETYNVEDINLDLILLNGLITPDIESAEISDFDNDGILDLRLTFDRVAVQALFETEGNFEVVITGELVDETPFIAKDIIQLFTPKSSYYLIPALTSVIPIISLKKRYFI